MYTLYSLDYVLKKDFRNFLRPSARQLASIKHGPRQWTVLVLGKAFYLGCMLVVPIVIVGQPVWLVILSFVLAHFLIGMVILLIMLQTTHLVTGTQFFREVNPDFACHVLATTQDVAISNRALTWFSGGLNHHVIHHLFPGICHTHYEQLTPLICQTAKEFGMPYRSSPSLRSAIGQHLAGLRALRTTA